ncbi:hypothetical protein LCGC14_3019140 [marine sediment metagenome]|uniref:Flagellar hook-associated protein 2 C-terminal domain-containing protein n=1 Tax=marine sediment metagenome TaxID=412755 RepID=A0A0F8ZLZ8_9ZZZZ
MDGFLKSGGIFKTREDGFQTQLRDIEDERVQLNYRLDAIEARYRSQFAVLDILVSQLKSTGDFLLQQLDASAKIISRNSN